MKKGTVIFITLLIVFLALFSNLSFIAYDESRHENYEESREDIGLPINDSDGDGMPDGWEVRYGLNPLDASDADIDMDFLPVKWRLFGSEGDGWDFDRDGTIDDEEKFTNLEEYLNGTDPTNWDSDEDGMPDGWEVYYELDPTDRRDASQDLDEDGYDSNRNGKISLSENFTNLEEFREDTNPNSTDTDLDGMLDGWEYYYGLEPTDPEDAWEDPDDDGGYYWDEGQVKYFRFVNLMEFLTDTHPTHNDTDADGMFDGWETVYFLNPLVGADKNGDKDNDDLENIDEYLNPFDVDGITHSNPTEPDTDGDGLTDGDEIHGTSGYITDPTNNDTDSDGMDDGWEIYYSLNPRFYPDRFYDNDTDGFDFDFDGDVASWEGFPNYLEYVFKTDPWNNDTDGDVMTDGYEALLGLDPLNDDRDEDFDNDSFDGDGNGRIEGKENMSNIREFNLGTLAGRNDSDQDGMPDGWEVYYELNATNFRDADMDKDRDGADVDRDGDKSQEERFTNLEEYLNGTHPNSTDTDGDGMWDGWEVYYGLDPLDPTDTEFDPDLDGINNSVEFTNTFDNDGITQTDPTHNDTDEDGVGDGDELNGTFGYITDPTMGDTDADGMPDGWELLYGLNPRDPTDAATDLDNDQLSNLNEYLNGTEPNNTDTDRDGMWDGWEVHYELDPLYNDSYEDGDDDGLINLLEFMNPATNDSDGDRQTDPTNPDSDGDGIWDGDEVFGTVGSLGYVTDPTNNDTDFDGLEDLEEHVAGADGFITVPTEFDTDGDMMPDGWETNYGSGWLGDDGELHFLDPTDGADAALDPDDDGFDANFNGIIENNERFTNLGEFQFGTNPFDWDSDDDEMSDGFEAFFDPGRRGR